MTAIYDTSGNMVARYLYDAWGNCTISNDTTDYALASANPIRYRGYYYDDDTGLYYCNARYYSPKWRRFISPDDTSYLDTETVNGLNLYCYCGNDPVNYADPSGHFVITLSTILWAAAIGAAVGLTAGGFAGAAVAACNDTDILTGFISGAVGGVIMGAGAGVGALFLAPLIFGESVAIGIAGGVTALGTKAVIGAGLSIGGLTGALGGGLADLGNQLGNNGMNWRKVDYGSVAVSAVEYGALNMLSTGLGSLLGPHLSNSMNFLGSKMLNVIPTGWGFVIDVLRGQL